MFNIQSYVVNEKGDVYLLARLYEDVAKEQRQGKVNYKYVVLSYSSNGDAPKEYNIALDDKFLTDMQIAINDNNDIICAGFYSEKGTSSIRGTFFMRVDGETKQVVKKSMKEFSLDFITMELTEKQAEKIEKKAEKGKDIELYQFSLDDLVIRSDGGIVLTGEQYFVRVHTYTTSNPNGGMSTTTVYKYHYNDIIVININPEGNIQWATKIPKTQITSNDGGFFSSYTMAVTADKLYFVFNDNPKNLVSSEGKTFNFVPYKESHVVCVQLDKDGKVEKKSLFSSKDVDIITRPKVCKQINDNGLLIFGQRKSTQRFALMTF